MNVSIVQQFFRSLIRPLEESAAPAQLIAGLERACEGFEPFRDKDVDEFAEFLNRAVGYERDGKWPNFKPPIQGHVIDEPSARDYAQRLRTFLQREVPAGGSISDSVRAELVSLEKRLKLKGVSEMARELQVEESFTNAKQGMERIVYKLTGQHVSEKKPRASSRSSASKTDPAMIQRYSAELRNLTNSIELEQRVNVLTKQLKVEELQALAESLGAAKKAKKKALLSDIILSALNAPKTGTPTERGEIAPSSRDHNVAQLVEIIASLKSKAERPDAPYEEIETELRSLDGQMNRDEAIAVAKQIGIIRHLNSRNEAIEEISRKVFEMKRARESIAY